MNKSSNYRPVDDDFPKIDNIRTGMKVHVHGWSRGAVFVVKNINDKMANIQTPRTGKEYYIAVHRLRGTRNYK